MPDGTPIAELSDYVKERRPRGKDRDMNVICRIMRGAIVSVALTIVIFFALFGAQVFVWWSIPPITVVSISHACAPHHAYRNCVDFSSVVFVVIFGICLLRDLRTLLSGQGHPPAS